MGNLIKWFFRGIVKCVGKFGSESVNAHCMCENTLLALCLKLKY